MGLWQPERMFTWCLFKRFFKIKDCDKGEQTWGRRERKATSNLVVLGNNYTRVHITFGFSLRKAIPTILKPHRGTDLSVWCVCTITYVAQRSRFTKRALQRGFHRLKRERGPERRFKARGAQRSGVRTPARPAGAGTRGHPASPRHAPGDLSGPCAFTECLIWTGNPQPPGPWRSGGSTERLHFRVGASSQRRPQARRAQSERLGHSRLRRGRRPDARLPGPDARSPPRALPDLHTQRSRAPAHRGLSAAHARGPASATPAMAATAAGPGPAP